VGRQVQVGQVLVLLQVQELADRVPVDRGQVPVDRVPVERAARVRVRLDHLPAVQGRVRQERLQVAESRENLFLPAPVSLIVEKPRP
jgi:hypothetical protein